MRFIIALLLLLLLSQQSYALSCAAISPQERITEYTDLAFVGVVANSSLDENDSIEEVPLGEPIPFPEPVDEVITFAVEKVYSGDFQEEITVTKKCWKGCRGSSQGKYLVLARETDGGYELGWCDSLLSFERALKQVEDHLAILESENSQPETPPPENNQYGLLPQPTIFERFWGWLTFWK